MNDFVSNFAQFPNLLTQVEGIDAGNAVPECGKSKERCLIAEPIVQAKIPEVLFLNGLFSAFLEFIFAERSVEAELVPFPFLNTPFRRASRV